MPSGSTHSVALSTLPDSRVAEHTLSPGCSNARASRGEDACRDRSTRVHEGAACANSAASARKRCANKRTKMQKRVTKQANTRGHGDTDTSRPRFTTILQYKSIAFSLRYRITPRFPPLSLMIENQGRIRTEFKRDLTSSAWKSRARSDPMHTTYEPHGRPSNAYQSHAQTWPDSQH